MSAGIRNGVGLPGWMLLALENRSLDQYQLRLTAVGVDVLVLSWKSNVAGEQGSQRGRIESVQNRIHGQREGIVMYSNLADTLSCYWSNWLFFCWYLSWNLPIKSILQMLEFCNSWINVLVDEVLKTREFTSPSSVETHLNISIFFSSKLNFRDEEKLSKVR